MGVDVRAVRQEMAKPRSMGWLVEKNEATEVVCRDGVQIPAKYFRTLKKTGKVLEWFLF